MWCSEDTESQPHEAAAGEAWEAVQGPPSHRGLRGQMAPVLDTLLPLDPQPGRKVLGPRGFENLKSLLWGDGWVIADHGSSRGVALIPEALIVLRVRLCLLNDILSRSCACRVCVCVSYVCVCMDVNVYIYVYMFECVYVCMCECDCMYACVPGQCVLRLTS